jgi:hypothetical protein
MRKQTTKTQSTDQNTHAPRLLSSSDLEQVTGGVMKTRHDTIKNSIGNVR